MSNTKYSISFKALFGYVLLTAFAAITVWFIYTKIKDITRATQPDDAGQKMVLISEAATRLYTNEGLSRNIIQNKDTTLLPDFKLSIDTISGILQQLKGLYDSPSTRNELDSIGSLLDLKEQNLLELLEFREQNASNNYYDRVLKRLEDSDYLFGSKDYHQMTKNLEPYQRKVVVEFLQYAEEDNADRLTNRTADELINTTKQVLLALEMQEHKYQESITEKENKLLANDLKISDRLRKLRAKIEQEELQNSLQKIAEGQKNVGETNLVLLVFGIAFLLTILVFGVMILKDSKRSRENRIQLEKSKAYAEQLLASREQIMATVTHDLRSPLNSIMGYVDLMAKTGLNPKQNNYLKHLKRSSDYTMKLVNDLLDLSKLEAGKLTIEHFPFNPKKLIEEVIHTHIPSPDPKNLDIVVEVPVGLDQNYLSDPFRIQQILANLIGNAYKFTDKGKIEVKAHSQEIKERLHLKVEICDTGIGIPMEKQELIFEEFSQVLRDNGQKNEGFGLGLTITQKILDLLGGKIKVESEEGKGTCFEVLIPVEPTYQEIFVEDSGQKKLKLIGAEGKKALLVDDDPAQLNLLAEILKNADFKIQKTSNGKKALAILEASDFDLVLTDIQMPEMDGIELIETIVKTHKDLPVIALSGMAHKEEQYYRDLGFAGYLLKPYKIDHLIRLLADILDLEMESVEWEPNETPLEYNGVFNLEELKVFTDGDMEAFKEILESLKDTMKSNLAELQTASDQLDYKQLATVSHRMLPMLRQIHAREVIKPLEKMELGQFEENSETLEKEMTGLEENLNRIIAELEKEIELI